MALSEDLAFEWILTDIPLFCVGLMGMGFITFVFATLKRVNLDAFYLYVASLLLFFAAIIDLGQLLLRGPTKVSRNLDLDSVVGFTTAREILLALSSGFLFLFFWKVVGQCPPAEKRESMHQLNKMGEACTHSASWSRWGVPGIVLQWFTLALVVVIALLQIVWRIVDGQRVYGSVYMAQTTLEIVAAGIFILKILSNLFVSGGTSRWVPFRWYLGLISAILITTAIGIGNLIMFTFSETVLGRFLHAIGIYILLVTNLINTFQNNIPPRVSIDDEEARKTPNMISDSEKLQEPLTIDTNIQPAVTFQQRSPSIITVDHILSPPLDASRLPVRTVSGASRLSTFVSRAIMSPVLELSEGSSSLSTNVTPSGGPSAKSSTLTSPVKKSRMSDLHFDIVTPRGETFHSRSDRPTTDISLSYYAMDIGSDILAAQNTSAAHGSNETLASSSPSQIRLPQSKPGHRGSNSLSSFDELMRQQNELDQSIAKLKFLSFDMHGNSSQHAVKQTSPSEISTSMKSRPQSTLASDSLSPHSEFSLSVFPEPPSRPESVIPATSSVRFSVPLMLRRKVTRHSFSNSVQIHPQASIPGSPRQISIPPRMTSAGTQYDVTSFIGDLTSPGNQEVATVIASAQNSLGDTIQENEQLDHYSSHGDMVLETTKAMNLRPMLLPNVAKEKRPLPAIKRPLGNPSGTVLTLPRPRAMTLRPLYLGTPAGSVPVPLSTNNTTVPFGPRRATRFATHKSQISIPKPDLDVLAEDAPEAYERPRPPPFLLALESGQQKLE